MLTLTKSAQYSDYSYINEISPNVAFHNEHALIGVSPFNSYFTVENMEKLFDWGLENFSNVQVFIPDEISSFTFQALGYTESKARKKTRRQDCYLINKVVKALINNGLTEDEASKKIICLSDFMHKEKYKELYDLCVDLFKSNQFFRNGCLSTSKWVLSNRGMASLVSDEAMDIAVKYFLAEFPLFLNAPEILNVSSSTFIYKDAPKFLENIYKEKLLVSPKQGFLSIKD